MEIRELYLRNFGKFSGKKIVLKDGINLFYGENESGKTTIHTFIKRYAVTGWSAEEEGHR